MNSPAPLTHPERSHRKKIRLPSKSARLAELFGIMIGDGGINNLWQANVSLNATSDARYAKHVSLLFEDHFGIRPAIRRRKDRNALIVSAASTTLVDFLVENGLPRGNKLNQSLRIPHWVMRSKAYRRACVRGLIDTDGCLYVHRHVVAGKNYRNIGLCFSSASPPLIRQVAGIFEEFGIIPHIEARGKNIYLYSADAVSRYLKVFGTSNDRISAVYRNWKRG